MVLRRSCLKFNTNYPDLAWTSMQAYETVHTSLLQAITYNLRDSQWTIVHSSNHARPILIPFRVRLRLAAVRDCLLSMPFISCMWSRISGRVNQAAAITIYKFIHICSCRTSKMVWLGFVRNGLIQAIISSANAERFKCLLILRKPRRNKPKWAQEVVGR